MATDTVPAPAWPDWPNRRRWPVAGRALLVVGLVTTDRLLLWLAEHSLERNQ